MMFPQVSSEFERICACGRSVCTTTLGLRGSDTSTAVKFFGALSCASQRMRRPSGAIWIDMPSPMPPKPSSRWWLSSLKFQVMGPPLLLGEVVFAAGFLGAGFAAVLVALLVALLAAGFAIAFLALAGAAFFAGFLTAAFFAAFFATFFLAAFIPFSPCPEIERTFSAFQRGGRDGGQRMRCRPREGGDPCPRGRGVWHDGSPMHVGYSRHAYLKRRSRVNPRSDARGRHLRVMRWPWPRGRAAAPSSSPGWRKSSSRAAAP